MASWARLEGALILAVEQAVAVAVGVVHEEDRVVAGVGAPPASFGELRPADLDRVLLSGGDVDKPLIGTSVRFSPGIGPLHRPSMRSAEDTPSPLQRMIDATGLLKAPDAWRP